MVGGGVATSPSPTQPGARLGQQLRRRVVGAQGGWLAHRVDLFLRCARRPCRTCRQRRHGFVHLGRHDGALLVGGWRALGFKGGYWSRRKPVVLTMIQPLAHAADTDWLAAVAAFEAMRMAATSSKVRSSRSRMAG